MLKHLGLLRNFRLDQCLPRPLLDRQRGFDLRAVSKGGSIFDLDKFRWLAGEYLRAEPLDELVEHVRPFVVAAGLCDAEALAARGDWFRELVRGEQERIGTYSELPERVAWAFAADDEVVYAPKAEAGVRKHAEAAATLIGVMIAAGRLDEAETQYREQHDRIGPDDAVAVLFTGSRRRAADGD